MNHPATHNANSSPQPQVPSPKRPDATQNIERQNFPNGPLSPSDRITYAQRSSKHKNRRLRQGHPVTPFLDFGDARQRSIPFLNPWNSAQAPARVLR